MSVVMTMNIKAASITAVCVLRILLGQVTDVKIQICSTFMNHNCTEDMSVVFQASL